MHTLEKLINFDKYSFEFVSAHVCLKNLSQQFVSFFFSYFNFLTFTLAAVGQFFFSYIFILFQCICVLLIFLQYNTVRSQLI